MRKGTGSGAKKFILHLEGGGWCGTPESCLERSRTELGSSHRWADELEKSGILSDDALVNPDFHDWNTVFIRYCDGGSFAGNRSVKIFTIFGANIFVESTKAFCANILSFKKQNYGPLKQKLAKYFVPLKAKL